MGVGQFDVVGGTGADVGEPGSGEALVFWGGTLLGNLLGVAPWALLLLPLVIGAVVLAAFLPVTAALAGLNAALHGRRHR